MLTRLLGLETEYAIRFSPRDDSLVGEEDNADCADFHSPGNRRFYDAIATVVRQRVITRKAGGIDPDSQEFLENGAALSFEQLPYSSGRHGLCEGSTPECESPSDVLLYQRAMDVLLQQSTLKAQRDLELEGIVGTLRLLKNCRDKDGEIYGVQENLEVEFASGFWLGLWRVGWALLIPWTLLWVAGIFSFVFALSLMLLVSAPLLYMIWALAGRLGHQDAMIQKWNRVRLGEGPRIARRFDSLLNLPSSGPTLLLLALCGFRKQRKKMSAFLVSRALISGAGTLDDDGVFALGEKSAKTNQHIRMGLHQSHSIYDTGNLLTDAASAVTLKLGGMKNLFKQRQRMQLGLADANLCDVAEYLKIGTTALVADLVESNAPLVVQLKDPVKALKIWRRNPHALVASSRGRVSAHQVQRLYLNAVSEALEHSAVPSMEAKEIVGLWREALDLIDKSDADAASRHVLCGRLDWATKRFLLETAGADLDPLARKKIDLRYHELGSGYYEDLKRQGVCIRLLSDEDIERAIIEPPENSPARLRARLIKSLKWEDAKVYMGWARATVKRKEGAEVFRFDDYR